MTSITRHLITCCLSLICTSLSFAQDNGQERIKTAIIDYFLTDREVIHLQLAKDIYSSSEDIWFKGYITSQNTRLPAARTTNVYFEIMNSDGRQMSKSLIYAGGGSMSGRLRLGKNFSSGKYYIRVFTNWMNNVTEDMSFIYPVTVINRDEKRAPNLSPDFSTAKIYISPEGGTLIAGIPNTVGIRVADCTGKALPVKEVGIFDKDNNLVKQVFLNKSGYGRVELEPTHQPFKAAFTEAGKTIEASFPNAELKGVTLEVNNYTNANKTIVKVKATNAMLGELKTHPLTLLIQQGSKANFFLVDFSNNSNVQEMSITSDYLFEGTNTIRILDKSYKQLAERLIFKYPAAMPTPNITTAARSGPNKTISLQTASPLSNMSFSVLPGQTRQTAVTDIHGSMLINPYIATQLYNTQYYFENPNKSKHFELDLLMLHQQSKHRWEDILKGPPVVSHEFDLGLSVTGKVDQILQGRDKYKVKLFSIKARLNEVADINEKNEFAFKNLVIEDSSYLKLSLVKMPDLNTALPGKIVSKIIPSGRTLHKNLNLPGKECALRFSEQEDDGFLSISQGAVMLADVEIEQQKTKLTRTHQFGNSLLRGYKIVPENNGLDVLDFIGRNGFEVNVYRGTVNILGLSRTTINGQRSSPVVYMDDMQLMDFDQLWGMQMEDVDEIYLNAHAIVPSLDNRIGIIKIYRKWLKPTDADRPKDRSTELMVTNGFRKIIPFDNADYTNQSGAAFDSYGLLHWEPNALTDESGNFSCKVQNPLSGQCKIRVEGISSDGKLISGTITLAPGK